MAPPPPAGLERWSTDATPSPPGALQRSSKDATPSPPGALQRSSEDATPSPPAGLERSSRMPPRLRQEVWNLGSSFSPSLRRAKRWRESLTYENHLHRHQRHGSYGPAVPDRRARPFPP